ncbi:MAG: hypothetical protein AAFN77_17125 [Planctomycetota bacterium]
MPPQSRRQRKYESDLQKVQMRNRMAAVLGLLTVAATAWFIWYITLDRKPAIFVSVNRVEHSGAREVPFAEESCTSIVDTFNTSKLGNAVPLSTHVVDAQDSMLEIPEGLRSGDTLMVYFQAHLVDADSRPSVLANKNQNSDGDTSPVYWIAPESNYVEKSIDTILTQLHDTPGELKILLLDAGRYSWSPTFPGRPMNRFQNALAEHLKQNPLGLDDNFWVIVSHADLEVSTTSTPLESSLFTFAVSESLKAFRKDGDSEIDVVKWFDDVQQRVRSYSRNFSGRSTQHPVLMRAGQGIVAGGVGGGPSVKPDDDSSESMLTFTWKEVEEQTETVNEPVKVSWSRFARDPDRQADTVDRFVGEIFKTENLTALPYESARALEDFLERSSQSIVVKWDPEQSKVRDEYLSQANIFQQSPAMIGKEYFDASQLKAKRDQVDGMRARIFEYLLWLRFRHQMRMLDDGIRDDVEKMLDPPIQLRVANSRLEESEAAVDDRQGSIESWSIDTLKQRNRELIDYVNDRIQNEKLTPYEAELLGTLSQRYMPLLRSTFKPSDGTVESPPSDSSDDGTESKSTFTLNLDKEAVPQPDSEYMEELIKNAKSETANLMDSIANGGDTQFRFYLAANGSDLAEPYRAVVPQIAWQELTPDILISGTSNGDRYMIPTDSVRRLRMNLKTTGVYAVDLEIRPVDDAAKNLPGLEFGFDKQFIDSKGLRELKPGATSFDRSDTFDLFFRCRNPEESAIGPQYRFEVIAKSWSANANETPITKTFPFSIELASNAKPLVRIKRTVGNPYGSDSLGTLTPFGASFDGRDWTPLEFQTLANVKSTFELTLRNNLESDRTYDVRLYRLGEPPAGTGEFRGDRVSPTAARNYIQWLAKNASKQGERVFDDRTKFQLVGQTSLVAAPGREEKIQLQPPPKEQPADLGEGEPKPKPPEGPIVFGMEQPMLIVLYTEDQFRDEEELLIPEWFQFVTVKIEYPGTPSLNAYKFLEEVFGERINDLPSLLVPSVDRDATARMTKISRQTYLNNDHEFERLSLDAILNQEVMRPRTEQESFLMVDLLGVPNYLLYNAAANDTSNLSRFELTGIRVTSKPEEWLVYPQTWSFSANRLDDRQYNWLATPADETKLIFVRPKEGDPRGSELTVELMMPTSGEDLLGSYKNDFRSRWKQGSIDHFFPNQRQHFLSLGDNGLEAWTTVGAHQRKLTGVDGYELTVSRRGNGDPKLGRWKFIMESLELDPKIIGAPDTVELLDGAFENQFVELDFSPIKPPVGLDDIMVYWNSGKIDKKNLAKLLSNDNATSQGRYRVSLAELMLAAGSKLSDLQAGTPVGLQIEATDFFGITTDDELEFQLVEPKKTIEKPKPKFGTLTLSLVNSTGKSAKVNWFGPQRNNSLGAVTINGNALPLNRTRDVNGMNVKVTNPSGATLKITGLWEGKYDIGIVAYATPDGQNQKLPHKAGGKVSIAEGDNQVEMTLKYGK